MNTELMHGINGTKDIFPVKAETVISAVEKAEENLAKCSWSFEVFNRSHTGVTWSAFVLNNDSLTRDICQVSAELISKRGALLESKNKYYKYITEAARLEEMAHKCDEDSTKERDDYLADAEAKKEMACQFNEPVLGCAKDIADLTNAYEQLEKMIIEKHGKFDEEVFEKEERPYWVKRLYRQSMRDVRQYGKIQAGNQGALEDLGMDPLAVERQIRKYIAQRTEIMAIAEQEEKDIDVSSTHLDAWINAIGEAFANVHDEKQKRKGMTTGILKEHLTLRE